MSAPPEPFTYTPLPEDGGSIRVVELLPGEFDDAIECGIFAAELDSGPSYEALSYTWGDVHNTTPIAIDGRRLHVTANLACALRYMRRPDAKRSLWIDAICINQQDVREKERQVRAIATIFKQSTQVLVWLGEEHDPLIHQHGPPPMPISEVFEVISNIAQGKSVAHLVGDNPWIRWSPSFLDLLKRAWFGRLWVVQETAVTDNPTLICGKWSIPWLHLYGAHMNSLAASLGFTANGAVAMKGALENYDALVNCWTFHQFWKTDKGLAEDELARRLLRVLVALKGKFRCSDERDRLYGILGMICAPDVVVSLPMEYEKSATAIFKELAVFMIESRKSLDILFGDRVNFDSSEYPGKPSWVPTWKAYSTVTRGFFMPPHIWKEGEAQEPRQPALADFRFNEDHSILYVKGSIVGGLSGIGTPPPYYPKDSGGKERRKALSQLLTMWENEVVHLPPLRAKGREDEFQAALGEMTTLWTPEIVHTPSWRAKWAYQRDAIEAFRTTLFHTEWPGYRSPVSQQHCYEVLLGRGGPHDGDEDTVESEIDAWAGFRWWDMNDMVPFRLRDGQFGMFEGGMELYSGHEILIALFPGGPGPVALRAEETGFRFLGSCYVQGLEDEESWEAFLDGKESMEFPLI